MDKNDTSLNNLRKGSLYRSFQKEITEPENIAVGQVSKELRYFQRQDEYVDEVQRILKELKLTKSLMEKVKEAGEGFDGVTQQELFLYYQGIFLTLIHQIKDKVVKVIDLLTEDLVPEEPSKEKRDITVIKLLKNKEKKIKEIGIKKEVEKWDDNNKESKIAVSLRKRTMHHHRVSGLKYNEDFQLINLVDILSDQNIYKSFNDHGKQQIEEQREKSIEKFFSNELDKTSETLEEIESNLERIAKSLIDYFQLPTAYEDIKAIHDDYNQMLGAFNVENNCSIEKIPTFYKDFLDEYKERIIDKHEDDILAIYLVGSLGRGEYKEGYSDINIYIITNSEVEGVEEMINDERVDLKVFIKEKFLSENQKKYRIIAKIDGILLHGEDIIAKEKIPKAGMFLALELNRNILNSLKDAKQWINDNTDTQPLDIAKCSKKIAKQIIDFFYGVAISNCPQFTTSRGERIKKIKEIYPEDKIDKLVKISQYGVGDVDSFKNVIDSLYPQIKKNVDHMLYIEESLKNDYQ